MKLVVICLIALCTISVQSKYCTRDSDCNGYICKDELCCKQQGESCGAGYSWPCCNSCKIKKYSAWGTCT